MPPELRSQYGEEVYGCDWNRVHEEKMAKPDMVAVFKYNLDLRLHSNRAPLHLCIHAQYFGTEHWMGQAAKESVDAMRQAFSQMIDYALSKPEVRVVRSIDVLRWVQDPMPLGGA